jgi:hypothetical protein
MNWTVELTLCNSLILIWEGTLADDGRRSARASATNQSPEGKALAGFSHHLQPI